MILDTSLLNTQQYKVRIKGKVEQSREWSSVLPYISVHTFWSSSTIVANFPFFLYTHTHTHTHTHIYIYIYICTRTRVCVYVCVCVCEQADVHVSVVGNWHSDWSSNSWLGLFTFAIELIQFGRVWIQLFPPP